MKETGVGLDPKTIGFNFPPDQVSITRIRNMHLGDGISMLFQRSVSRSRRVTNGRSNASWILSLGPRKSQSLPSLWNVYQLRRDRSKVGRRLHPAFWNPKPRFHRICSENLSWIRSSICLLIDPFPDLGGRFYFLGRDLVGSGEGYEDGEEWSKYEQEVENRYHSPRSRNWSVTLSNLSLFYAEKKNPETFRFEMAGSNLQSVLAHIDLC